MENAYYKYRSEAAEADKLDTRSEDEQQKDELVSKLSGSRSFAFTHLIIEKLSEYAEWSREQCERLFDTLINNAQVSWILCDDDVNKFYLNLFKYCDSASENAKKVKEMLEESKED